METAEATPAERRARTQWAAQFLAAGELVRRGYTVSFTMGNHTPMADLMVGAASRQQFWVDVKGLASKAAWLVKPKLEHENLFYILVYLAPLAVPGKTRNPDRFFVLSQREVNRLVEKYQTAHRTNRGTMPGFRWTDAHVFEDEWRKLPR
jgi:hypothetical protein